MQPDEGPLLIAEHDERYLPADQILLVADVLVRGEEDIVSHLGLPGSTLRFRVGASRLAWHG